MSEAIDRFLARVDTLLDRLEAMLPQGAQAVDWSAATAFRWRKRGGRGFLDPVRHPHAIAFADLLDIDDQKKRVRQNTAQFVAGRPANNVLLTGARGTGKSSLIKAALNEFSRRGLRLIEVDKADLVDLPDIVDLVAERPERFIVFCDDLSFEASDPGYKSLKVALDGTIAGSADNLLIYATSNRRHLMPERMAENLEATHADDGEIHPGETTEEKISLSERFGLWLSFYPFDQDHYLAICTHWLRHFGVEEKLCGAVSSRTALAARQEALQWSLERGSRSGRVAWQFARDYAGRSRRT